MFKLLDNVIELLEESPVANAIAGVIDTPLSEMEQRMGLGEDARRVYYGESSPPRQSLILNYLDSLIQKAQEDTEPENKSIDPGYFVPEDRKSAREDNSGNIKNMFSKVREAARDAGTFAGELFEKKPKILDGDTLTPYERVKRHMKFERADRVAVAPLAGFNVAHVGDITVREFMTDGRKAARAARRYWDTHGGFDMIPFGFPAGYLFPLVPESHSRFMSRWILPEKNELPKMEEVHLLPGYEELAESGIIPMVRTESGHLLREFRRAAVQAAIYGANMARYFPRTDLFHPYAMSVVNHPADLLSMWLGFERFMIDCATDPLKVREACEMLSPGLVEFGEFAARLSGSKQVLYGVSRVSGSWISRKMFDDLFAETFKEQAWKLHDDGFTITYHLDNDYTPMLDFFKELPRHSGFMHLDQTDMLKAKEMLHGHLCLMGNLHPGISAAGTPEDVEAACERLIKDVGADGGFILCSACEVPLNAPVENIQAMKRAVDKWGWY